MLTARDLSDRLKTEALRLGFDAVGIAPAVEAGDYPHYLHWLDAGHDAGMAYLRKNPAIRAHPKSILEGVRSVVVCSMVYGRKHAEPAAEAKSKGKVARYAQGADYHRVLWDRLAAVVDWLDIQNPAIKSRAVADTAPLLERDFARLAGLGWIGKNTMLLSRRLGSFTVLGAILTDAELAYDTPHSANHCGTCTRCLDACPTNAFAGPYDLDARRCISYWTIEHKGMPAEPQAGQLNGWVFGCDICQDVCPWNRKAPSEREPAFHPRPEWTDPDLIEWLTRDPATWRTLLKGTALARAKRAGLVRNAALVLGARRLERAVAPLAALLDDPREDPTVRAAAAWALRRIDTAKAREALARQVADPDAHVRDSVDNAPSAAEP